MRLLRGGVGEIRRTIIFLDHCSSSALLPGANRPHSHHRPHPGSHGDTIANPAFVSNALSLNEYATFGSADAIGRQRSTDMM
jgi:hypothetical protein